MSPDVPRENLERWRARGARAIGGPYGGERTYLGHRPSITVSVVIDGVTLDSRTPTTKLHPTQLWPIVVRDEKDITAGTDFSVQWVGKFDQPINNLRSVAVPLFDPRHFHLDKPVSDGDSIQETLGILLMVLLKVDLNGGPFKLEDMTYDLVHHQDRIDGTTSNLFSDPNNFVQVDSVPGFFGANGFSIFPFSGRTRIFPSFGHGLSEIQVGVSGDPIFPGDNGGVFWFYNSGPGADTRQHGDLGPFTGILLYYNPPAPGGGNPPPTAAGEFSHLRSPIPDPRPGAGGSNEGRFPYAIGSNLQVVDE